MEHSKTLITISTAFMGVTTGCAKCHDHMYDPILQRDYYAMKALFDPLLPEKKNLATAEELARHDDVVARWREEQNIIQARMDVLTKPYEKQIFEERMTFLPKDVEAVFRKDPKLRTAAEQEIVKRYETVVTPDARKFRDVMKPSETVLYEWTRKGQTELRRDPPTLPVFWTVRADAARGARVFLFDEPTRGIDIGAKVEVFEVMDELARQGAAILMVSSELPELLQVADRILVMRQGRLAGELPGRTTQEEIMRLATLPSSSTELAE